MNAVQPTPTRGASYRVGDSQFVVLAVGAGWRVHHICLSGVRVVCDLDGHALPLAEFRRSVAHELLQAQACEASLVRGEVELVVFRDPLLGAHLVGGGDAYEGFLRYFPTVDRALGQWHLHARAILNGVAGG